MSMPLLPEWLRAAWVVALCGVTALHLWHAWSMHGQRRLWHAGHTVMAVGMALMYLLPAMSHPTLYEGGRTVFGALTVLLVVSTVLLRRREGLFNPLWVAAAVDMLVMTYMLLPAGTRPVALTGVFVLYLGAQAVAWALGLWDRAPAYRSTAPTPAGGPGTPSAGGTGAGVGLVAHSTAAVRVSLAVMAVSMAYMLAIM